MAGSDSRFNAAKFREGIRFAMEMGFPQDEAKQITWRWTPRRTYQKPDSGGSPFDWQASQVVTERDIEDYIVLCAVEFQPASGATRVGGTALGVFDLATAKVTLLDVDYDDLLDHGNGEFPDEAYMDGNRYATQLQAPPMGLLEVTVYQVLLQAPDET